MPSLSDLTESISPVVVSTELIEDPRFVVYPAIIEPLSFGGFFLSCCVTRHFKDASIDPRIFL